MAPSKPVWLFLVILALAIAGGTVWIRTATVQSTYESLKLHRKLRTVESEYRELRMHWLELTSPSRLEALAKKLEMHQPDRERHRHYEPVDRRQHQHTL